MEKASLGPRKVLRAPALRRGREIVPISDRVKLERVLGFTVSSNAGLDCDPQTSIVAYPAGCVVVIYNVRKNKQGHILSSSKKTITSLAFSADGKYLATGECGHQPHVRVWDVQERTQIAEFQGHKYGINCVAFSPNLKYVVSVGSQHDMIVNVWDWKNNVKVASNKVSCKVKAISFASNGNYFVTVGNRHVKFWYLEYSRSAKYKLEPVPLMGRSAILGDQRNNYFCDVACGKSDMTESTYAITKSGLLCEFNSRRLLDKWVELRTSSANSISVGEEFIFIGCAEGVIRCFSPYNLNFLSTLPRPHYLGVDVAKGLVGSRQMSTHPSSAKYPDTVAIALDENNKKVTCIYNDHSLYVWDVKDIKKVGKSHSFLYHSACIWGIETYPELPESGKKVLPKGTFLTCSSDDTIRIWNLDPTLAQDTAYHRNIYSSELLKILYVDPDLSYLCDVDFNPSGSNDKVDTTYDGKNGVRCLRINPNGKHLASGDRSGNIRIHDLEFVEELCKVEAHDSEVLCLEYSKPITVGGKEKMYLASASRDRLIHVFDVKQDYTFQQTLDDHSSSITAVRFVQSGGLLQMISCGADKSIIFRKAQFNPQLSLIREHHVVGKTTLYDMEVDIQQRHILTACQDRNIRVYSVVNGKHGRCFRGSQGEDGTLIKVVLDPSGTYLATSCTDKSLYIYDYFSGECLATMFGHSELVTGLKFTNNGRHLISVSGDGCIFLWRLPTELTQTMLNKQISLDTNLPSLWQEGRKGAIGVTKPLQILEKAEKINSTSDLVNANNIGNNEDTPPGYRFSMGQLPLWAKKQMLEELSPTTAKPNQKIAPPVPPRGRWAQRIDGQGLVVKSYLDSDAVIPFPSLSEEQENTPKSSNNTKNINENKQETVVLRKENDHGDLFEVCEESLKEIHSEKFSEESSERVTLRRGFDSLVALNNKRERAHQLSNSNNISSLKLEDMDAEDERSDSEVSEMVYYPASEDGSEVGDSSFHVCANNEDSLKEVQKKPRKPRPERLYTEVPVISTPEQGETNSDEEDASTPVDSDRSFLSSLCVSTENLERLGQREKFMKSNYESLEKENSVELRMEKESEDRNFYRHSISAKFLAGSLASPIRPTANGISKVPQTLDRQMSTPTKKREELNKALSEAKKKLETVGFRSGLSSSKSIGDLHNIPDRDSYRKPRFGVADGDIRRAASMNDLSISNLSNRQFASAQESSKDISDIEKVAPLWNQNKVNTNDSSPAPPNSSSLETPASSPVYNKGRSGARRTTEGKNETSGPMSRSISMGALNAGATHNSTLSPVHKTPSVYTLARVTASPRQQPASYTSPLAKNQFTSSSSNVGRTSLPSLPSRRQPVGLVTSAPLATDSSSDSSPTESTPKPFPSSVHSSTRTRYLSSGDAPQSKYLETDSRHSLSSARELRQYDKLKSRSEWDLKSACDSNTKDLRQSSSSRYVPDSPKKGYLRLEKLSRVNTENTLASITTHRSRDLTEENVPSGATASLPLDPTSVPLTQELCESISEELKRITSYAMQIFQRITLNSELAAGEKSLMTNVLAQGVWQAQQNLRPAVPPMPMWPSSSGFDSHLQSPRRLPGLNTQPQSGDPSDSPSQRFTPGMDSQPEVIDTMALLQQFSDKLLSIVEQQINKGSQEKPNN